MVSRAMAAVCFCIVVGRLSLHGTQRSCSLSSHRAQSVDDDSAAVADCAFPCVQVVLCLCSAHTFYNDLSQVSACSNADSSGQDRRDVLLSLLGGNWVRLAVFNDLYGRVLWYIRGFDSLFAVVNRD